MSDLTDLLAQAKREYETAKQRINAAHAAKTAALGTVERRNALKTKLRMDRDEAILAAHSAYKLGVQALDRQYHEQAAIARDCASAQCAYTAARANVLMLEAAIKEREAADV